MIVLSWLKVCCVLVLVFALCRPFAKGFVFESAEVSLNSSTHIVNGNAVEIETYPEVMYVVFKVGPRIALVCTGTVIDERLVLVTATCVSRGIQDLYVCRGADIRKKGDCLPVLSVRSSPRFISDNILIGNDIAIVATRESLLEIGARPIKLSMLPLMELQEAVSVGYGRVNEDNSRSFGYMQSVRLQVFGSTYCPTLQQSRRGRENPNLVCAMAESSEQRGSMCFADMGAPLIIGGPATEDRYLGGLMTSKVGAAEGSSCTGAYPDVFMTIASNSHLNFLNASAAELGGIINFVESPECNLTAVRSCTDVSMLLSTDLGCLGASEMVDGCCENTAAMLDCLEPYYFECGNQVLIDYLSVARDYIDSRCRSACFPAEAKVIRSDGREVSMRSLQIGDAILTSEGKFSPIFAFSKKVDGVLSSFVHIDSGNVSIELSPEHYLHVNGKLFAAKSIRVGDFIQLANGSTSLVSNVKMVHRKGLYNPHILAGPVVVNGVLASSYTQAVHPFLARVLLSFPRLLFSMGIKEPFSPLLHGTIPRALLSLLPRGPTIL
eukprot:Plantae.Rhodophyta-Purpureofilum_apyrenoidigerum.ctg6228.p1 GENE.Plantae.Rhodophyta-Purpureofilum_apyrenoidigerum.ctg6228~~Plantae.Rhodophyta-Purpureofilum_apyrenoidigerum.ctg6228.p1  ORF type:complete len:551 (-),score=51.02 Plantae.Rhodophyta-Purpureofilum_apyrenoidigerum.ctg6228:1232-2884(-)